MTDSIFQSVARDQTCFGLHAEYAQIRIGDKAFVNDAAAVEKAMRLVRTSVAIGNDS